MKYLFVCLGNSERSVIAEELFRKFSKIDEIVSSAGVKINNLKRSKNMFKLMKNKRIDISNKLKIQLYNDLISNYDKIFVLCKKINVLNIY